jgi:hypothetical protein
LNGVDIVGGGGKGGQVKQTGGDGRGTPSKGILHVAVLHSFNLDRGEGNEEVSIEPAGCVPVLIVEDGDGSYDTLWLNEFYLLELGRGVAARAPLPPSNSTVDANVFVPAKVKTLNELL